jgi:UDP-N-acetyl-D-mannosaminuronate dehydrogenase
MLLKTDGVDREVSLYSLPLNSEQIKASDCVVITVAHDEYDLEEVVREAPIIFDTVNATGTMISVKDHEIYRL